jgi:hypothetical protein
VRCGMANRHVGLLLERDPGGAVRWACALRR